MKSDHSRNESEMIELISKLWTYVCLPLLFFLIGNEIEFEKISIDFIGKLFLKYNLYYILKFDNLIFFLC